MNNLVLGSSGKIGKYYFSKSKLKFNFFSSSKKNKKYFHLPINTKKIGAFIKKKNISTVIIFTALSNPEECRANLKYSNKINVIFIKELIRLLIKLKIYFIFFSTEYVYPGDLDLKKKYTEKSQIKTKMIYGKQKITIENYLKKKNYKNYSILRLSKTFGDRENDKTLFTEVLSKYKKGHRKFEIASDQFFCPLYVGDLVQIIDIFVKKKIKGLYNVCGNVCKSRYDLIKLLFDLKMVKDVQLKKCSIKKFDKKLFFPSNLNLSNKKIKKRISFNFTNLSEIIKKLK